MSSSTTSGSNRPTALLGVGVIALAGAVLARLLLGSVPIPLPTALRALMGLSIESDSLRRIVLEFRLPRALTAAGAGAALGVAGLLMQTLFRNPLAGPSVLGVSAGASLGVALVVLAGSSLGIMVTGGSGLLSALAKGGDSVIVASASVGAAAVMIVVLLASSRVESELTILVLGVLFSYAVSAVVNILMHFSIPEEIQSYVNWTFGSFAGVTAAQLPLFGIPLLVALGCCAILIRPLDAMLLGEEYARSMGIHIVRLRVAVIAITSLLAGVVTAYCGPIGFVGVAVPHLARAVFRTADHGLLLPATLLLGAIVAVVSDLIASLPGVPLTLPLNAVTSLLGAPVVVAVILRRGGLRGRFA